MAYDESPYQWDVVSARLARSPAVLVAVRLSAAVAVGLVFSLGTTHGPAAPVPSDGSTAAAAAIDLGGVAETRSQPGVWIDGYGSGFDPSTRVLTVSGGIGIGVEMFGGVEKHDLALLNAGYGRLIGPPQFTNHWFRGQWEIRGELFGGVEYSPNDEWLVGAAGQLRYNFLTGTPWMPFFGGGAGVLATSIREPDLSNTFEFNLQLGVGTHYFLNENLALTGEARFMHISCAGISSPNLGVNDFIGYLGVSWFF